MKRLVLALLLAASPVLAQEATQEATPEQFISATQVLISDALTQMKSAMIMRDRQIALLRDDHAKLTKQVEDLTKERDSLKAKAEPPKDPPK